MSGETAYVFRSIPSPRPEGGKVTAASSSVMNLVMVCSPVQYQYRIRDG